MSLHYVTVDRYSKFMPGVPPSEKHPGGGMGPKTLNAIDAWRRFYQVYVSQDINAHPTVDILVVEPLWFNLRGGFGNLENPDLEEAVSAYEKHPAGIKVIYQSEFTMLKLPAEFRTRIVKASSVVTSNCTYQKRMYEMMGIKTVRLCDPQSEDVYYHPTVPKELSIIAMSRISTQKNTQKVVEVFKLLKDTPIETVFAGGASLWGFSRKQDLEIEQELRSVSNRFYHNLTQLPLGKLLASCGCAMFDVFHDCCASSNLQALLAGCLCFYGMHGLFIERPGIHELDSPSEFVDAIAEATEDFKQPPDAKHRLKAETWALGDSSCEQFLKDWEGVMRHAA